jgi:hypothetical protein
LEVSEEKLIDGVSIRCGHCKANTVLSENWTGHAGGYHWELIEAGDDDEPQEAQD